MFNQYLIALDLNAGQHPPVFLYLTTSESKPWKKFSYQDVQTFEDYFSALEVVEALRKIWPKAVFVIRQPKVTEDDLTTIESMLVTSHSLSNINHTYESKVEIK